MDNAPAETADHTGPKGPTVVVGVDGSAGGNEALRWALAEARLRNAPLRAVHAWMFGYIGGTIEGYPYPGRPLGASTSLGVDLSDMHRAAENLLDQALAAADADAAGIVVERHVVQGSAAEALVSAVNADDLLVVGSRGHGAFSEFVLGSVSQQCVHHAPCPVVVVHPPKSAAATAEQAHEDHQEPPARVAT